MASCRHIESLMQAHIDGEARESDRVIVDQHLAECRKCARLYRQQQRVSASLFEVFHEHRLDRDLTAPVMAHLPEMDSTFLDAREATYRAKNPRSRTARLLRLVPALAPALMVILGLTLVYFWPTSNQPLTGAVGMVTFLDGPVTCTTDDNLPVRHMGVQSYVHPGHEYIVGEGAGLILALAGPSHVKVGPNSRLRVRGERELVIEEGHAWLNVKEDVRLFRVSTPTGNIIVLGTTFDVRVEDDVTVVTVGKGRVHVENGVASRDLVSGEQVEVRSGATSFEARRIDAAEELAWAGWMQGDQRAEAMFARTVGPQSPQSLAAEQFFVVQTNGRAVHQITFQWTTGPESVHPGGYYVYVSDDHMNLIFVGRIPAAAFDGAAFEYDMPVPDGPLDGVRVLHIKVVPAGDGGASPVSFTKVSAWGV
jgi:hypothetical protein